MFTGIVTDIGEITALEARDNLRRLRIACRYPAEGIAIGASIACAGVCLTVIARGETGGPNWFDVEVAAETLRLTNAGKWQVGTRLNLERALKIGDELGGHIVSGHVDGLARVISREAITAEESNWGATARFELEAPAPLHRFVAVKGSITLDGVSLTVNTVDGQRFSVLLIPHTLEVTTLGTLQPWHDVHIEIDTMARYAARLAETA